MFVKDAQICDCSDHTLIYAGDSNIGSDNKTLESGAEWCPKNCNKLSTEKCLPTHGMLNILGHHKIQFMTMCLLLNIRNFIARVGTFLQ